MRMRLYTWLIASPRIQPCIPARTGDKAGGYQPAQYRSLGMWRAMNAE
jgi:hypothetical protein